jgi:16S rRNA (cytidine1402-2'-O)-methyltransferase
VPTSLSPGTLYLVSTPIGNLEDITYRAVRVLKAVDLIAAEDTRQTTKLCNHYDISTRRVSLHEHNESQRTPSLLKKLARGDTIAVVSDAGTPLVSDPGGTLTAEALAAGYKVVAIPGPSAVLTALASSGFSAENGFCFVGFPPPRSNNRIEFFLGLVDEPRPVVIFESPHRIIGCMTDLVGVFKDRRIAICRELTKIHESLVVRPINEVSDFILNNKLKGEITLVIEGQSTQKTERAQLEASNLLAEFGHLTESGLSRRAAIRTLATRYRCSTRDIYQGIETSKP